MSRVLALLGAAAALGLLGLAVAQPLFTDDLWWHLALGRAFAAGGPWLAEDPLLFGAAGPPAPAAWLFDLGAWGLYALGGFDALRVAFVAALAALLLGMGALLRRAGASTPLAAAGLVVLVALAAYRFAQLRPHLASMALAPLLFWLLLERGGVPSWRRVAAAGGLFALWANLHAGFPLGLLLLGAATAAVALAAALSGAEADRRRARRLAAALALAVLASGLHPQGFEAHRAWFAAGGATPELGSVYDEWSSAGLLRLPGPARPPTPVAWLALWGLWLATAALLPRALADLRRAPEARRLDPAWLGTAVAALVGMTLAVRFLWLGLFPLLLLARAWRPRPALAAALALLGAAGFATVGDWPLLTRGLPSDAAGWAEPFAARKYHPHAIGLMREAGLEGRLYCDYFQAGFAGFWLAPDVRTPLNGSLNAPRQRLDDLAAIAARRGALPGEDFETLLERLELDLFLGIRLPETGNPYRPWASTTAHLEDTPGWIPIFRNLDSALYLRSHPRNEENLARIAAHYAARGVPFDPERGFDARAALRSAPDWSAAQGLAPPGFAMLEHRAEAPGRPAARDRVAALYTALGLHEAALALDRRTLEQRPDAPRALRRAVWNALWLGRFEVAEALAPELAARPERDVLSRALALAAVEVSALEPAEARAALARLPVFYRAELPTLLRGVARPRARDLATPPVGG